MKKIFPLETWSKEKHLNVIVEAPKGQRNKFKYDEQLGLFKLSHVLPSGSLFPFDFGFIPSTRGADGDPLDVVLLVDEPTFPGCLVEARVIGVIEAKQKEDKKTMRNDRLIAIPVKSPHHANIKSIEQLNPIVLNEIEHFFASYNKMRGRVFTPLGRFGAQHALNLIKISSF